MSTQDRQTRRDGKKKYNTSATSKEDPKVKNTLARIGRRTSRRHSAEGSHETEKADVKKPTPHPQPKRPTTPAKEILPLAKRTSEKADNGPGEKNTPARTARRGSKHLNEDSDFGPKNAKAATIKPTSTEPLKSASPQVHQEITPTTKNTTERAKTELDVKNTSARTVQKGSKRLDGDTNWEPKNAKAASTKPTTPKLQKSPTFSPQVTTGGTGKVKTSKEFREWLISLLDSNNFCGLSWTNPEKTIFRIPWSASNKHFDPEHHALYLEYAIFMERPQEEIDSRDLQKWKTQVRAKINQQRDVVQLPEWTTGLEGAPGTFKVFEFRDPNKAMTVDRSLRDRSQSYCGPWSQTLGVKQYDILCGRVKDIPPSCVTVGLILEVYDFWKRREMNNDILREWIGLFLQGEAPKDILHVVESLQIRRCALESSGGNVNSFEKAMFRYKPVSLTAPTVSKDVSPEKGDSSDINLPKESPKHTVSPTVTKPGGVLFNKPPVPQALSPASAPPCIERPQVTATSTSPGALTQSKATSAPSTAAKGPGYLGPCCEKFGITQLKLLQSDFEPLSKWQLTNALVLEIYYFWQSLRFSSERFVSWMSKLANQELNVKRVTKAIIKMERKRHQMVLQRSRGGRPELDTFDNALFPAYRYRTDVKYAQCQVSGCKKFPKQDAGYCSRHWKVVSKEQTSQTPASSAKAPHRRKSRDPGMPFSWQQINRLQKDLVAVTSSAEGTSRLPKVCIICNVSLESSSGHLMLDEVVESDTKTDTVRARLQRVLGEKPKGSTRLCSMCHSTLCQIEEFYNVIGLFKCQYIQSTTLRKPGVGAKAKAVPRNNDQDVILLGPSPTDQNNGNKRKADHLDALGILDQANPVLKSIKWPADILRNLSASTADFLAQSHLPKELRQKSEQKKWGHFVVKLDQLTPDQLPKTMTTQKQKRRKILLSKAKSPRILVTKGQTLSYQQSAQSSQPIVLGTLACLSSKKPGLLSRPPTSASLRIKNCPNLTRLMKEARASGGKRNVRIESSSMHTVSAPNILDLDSNNLFYNDPFLDQMETENTPINTSLDSTDTGHGELTPDPNQDGICISDVRSLLNMQMTDGTLAICIEPEGAMKDDVITENFQSFPGAGDRDILVTGVSGSSSFLPDPIPDMSIGALPGVIEILPQDGVHSQPELGIQDPMAVVEIAPTTENESYQEANSSWDMTESCSTTGTLNSSEQSDKHPSERITEGLDNILTSEGLGESTGTMSVRPSGNATSEEEMEISPSEGLIVNEASQEQIVICPSGGLSENLSDSPGQNHPSQAFVESNTLEGLNEIYPSEGLALVATSAGLREKHICGALGENIMNEGLGENIMNEGPAEDIMSEGPAENIMSEGLCQNLTNQGVSNNPVSEGLIDKSNNEGLSENPTREGQSENPAREGPSENLTNERLSKNPTSEGLSQKPASDGLSENPATEGLSENPSSEGLNENLTFEGLSENLTNKGPSENPTSEGLSKNLTNERLSENPSIEGLDENPTSEGLSENPTKEGLSGNPLIKGLSENPSFEELSENPSIEGLSKNPSIEGLSENPSIEGVSENPSIEGVSENPSIEGLGENPSIEGLSENLPSEELGENLTSEELGVNPTCK